MGELSVENKVVVVPGEQLAVGMDFVSSYGTYRDDEIICSNILGLASIDGRVIKVIPLSGLYLPVKGDVVIGQVVDILLSGWRIDINSPYSSVLSLKEATSDFIARGSDITRYFNFDDWVVVKIVNVSGQNIVDVSAKGPGLRRLGPGRVITVNPTKVPRIIGKQGSMVKMINEITGCRVTVGQNGVVWLQGDPESELKVVDAIRKIEKEAHVSGLTERVKSFLEGKK